MKYIFFSLLSGLLLIFSFPNFNFWPLAWFGFVPAFLALKNKTRKQAFFLFFFTGIVFWSGIIYWLVHVTLAGIIILILYLALYFALFGLIVRNCFQYPTPCNLFFVPSIWVLLEYIRGHLFTGFPWELLGYSQQSNLPVIQISDITGPWGCSFLVMFINVAIAEIIHSLKNNLRHRLKNTFILSTMVMVLSLGYGYFRIIVINSDTRQSKSIKVAVIQGNIPQEFKWDERYTKFTLSKYLALSRSSAKDNPQLIVWPEAAVPGILGEDDQVYKEVFSLAKEIKIPLLTGAVSMGGDDYFGSALLISPEGEIAGRYDKIHRVPFGEYIPFKSIFPFLKTIVPIGDIQKGKEYTIFFLDFSVLNCFEDVFPDLSRNFVKRGAKFLVNIANDAWYKKTSAPWQHLQASVFRAIENRVYLARAANTGVSGFIDPTGKVISLIRDKSGEIIFTDGFASQYLYMSSRPYSFYTLYGDVFILACLAMILLLGFLVKKECKVNV